METKLTKKQKIVMASAITIFVGFAVFCLWKFFSDDKDIFIRIVEAAMVGWFFIILSALMSQARRYPPFGKEDDARWIAQIRYLRHYNMITALSLFALSLSVPVFIVHLIRYKPQTLAGCLNSIIHYFAGVIIAIAVPWAYFYLFYGIKKLLRK